MNITFSDLVELSFDGYQAAELSLSASQSTLVILYNNYEKFTALGLDNAQITQLATLNRGDALTIILSNADQFSDLYSQGFSINDVYAIAKTNPHNLEILFEYKFFVGSSQILTTIYFVACLSGNQITVEQLQKSIRDAVSDLVSYSVSELNSAQISNDDIEVPTQEQLERQLSDSLNEINNSTEPSTSINSLNLVYTYQNDVAKVITKNQLNEIQKDEAGDLYVMERNTKLILFAEDFRFEKKPSAIFNSIDLCFDKDDQFIGVVFNSNLNRSPVFTSYYVIKGGGLAKWVREPASKRPANLHMQLSAAQELCVSILQIGGIEYKPTAKRTHVSSGADSTTDSSKKAKSSHQVQTSHSTEASSSTALLQQTFLSEEPTDANDRFETSSIVIPAPPTLLANMPSRILPGRTDVIQLNVPEVSLWDSNAQISNNTPWFISRNIAQSPVVNPPPDDLIFHDTLLNHMAIVIKPNQVNDFDIQIDGAMNIFIYKNNMRLALLPPNLMQTKEIADIVKQICFCVDEESNFVGVVFKSHASTQPRFPRCEVIKCLTLQSRIIHARQSRRDELKLQLKIGQDMCAKILARVGVEFIPGRKKSSGGIKKIITYGQ